MLKIYTLYDLINWISLNVISNWGFFCSKCKGYIQYFKMTLLLISKYHQQTSIPCSIKKKDCFFFLPLFSHFCVHHLPPLLSPGRKASACSERAPEHGATALRPTAATLMRRRRTWYLGSRTKMAWWMRWWTWATFPRRCLHATSTRPYSRRTQTGWGAGGGALGVTLHCFVVRCLFVESSCWMCHRIQEWKPSNEQQVHDVIGSAGSWHAHLEAAFCFLWNSLLKVVQVFCHGWL